jgi:hypothetical protein
VGGTFAASLWCAAQTCRRSVTKRVMTRPVSARDHPALHPQKSNEVVLFTFGGAGVSGSTTNVSTFS